MLNMSLIARIPVFGHRSRQGSFFTLICIYFLTHQLTHVLVAQKNRLIETVLLSTHNMFWSRNKYFPVRTLIWGLFGYCKFESFRANFIFANGIKRDICHVKKSGPWHNLPRLVNDRVISRGIYFHKSSHLGSFAKIKPLQKFPISLTQSYLSARMVKNSACLAILLSR